MNPTIKEGEADQETIQWIVSPLNVKRFHYEDHGQLKIHLADYMSINNYARRLKALNGLTSYEYICKIWTSEPEKFIINPIHQVPGFASRRPNAVKEVVSV